MGLNTVTVVFFHPGLPDYVMRVCTYNQDDLAPYIITAKAVKNLYQSITKIAAEETPKSEFKCEASEQELAALFEY